MYLPCQMKRTVFHSTEAYSEMILVWGERGKTDFLSHLSCSCHLRMKFESKLVRGGAPHTVAKSRRTEAEGGGRRTTTNKRP